MNNNISSGITSISSIAVPELSCVITDGFSLDKMSSEAFAYAANSKHKALFSMRKFLNYIYPNGVHRCASPEDYAERIEMICRFAEMLTIPDDIKIVLPGLVIPPIELTEKPWDQKLYRRILSSGNSVTLYESPAYGFDFIYEMLCCAGDLSTPINIIYGRRIPEKHISIIKDLWKNGIDVTLCNSDKLSAVDAPDHDGKSFAVFDGKLMIPGHTVMTVRTLDMSTIEWDKQSYRDCYSRIKEEVELILSAEISRRFSYSARRKLYYHSDPHSDALEPFGLLYHGCFGSKADPNIRGIFTGGASDDVVAISPVNSEAISGMTEAEALRFLSAACITVSRKYPLRAVPCFKDPVYASNYDELLNIIKTRSAISANMFGGSVLEVAVPYLPDSKTLSSVITGFFGLGGMMIRFTLNGDDSYYE